MNKENSVFRSLELIESRITEKLTVENIASDVYFSQYHYQRMFREIIGNSVMEYVTKRKLTLAGRALLETSATILEIAIDYGYDSRDGFTRSFKAYMGVTPTEYRKYGLATISQKIVKERKIMLYSKTTDEIIRELNEFIAKAKDLAESVRKNGAQGYEPFWNSVADDTELFADKIKSVLSQITSITEHPDEIINRFSILKVIEETAFETNIMALHVNLTAVGRATPEEIKIHQPLCERYVNLAKLAAMKTEKVAEFLSELTSLIIDDMRKTAEEKIKDAILKGKNAAESIKDYAIYVKEELTHLVDELSSTPIENITVTILDDSLYKMKIISLAAKVDVFRMPNTKPMFEGIGVFMDSLSDATEFCRTIIQPENSPHVNHGVSKHFLDIAYQGNILRFYTRGEVEKCGFLGGLLNDEQKNAFNKIDGKIDKFIKSAREASNESAYKSIADKVQEIALDMNTEAEKLGVHGGTFRMLGEEFKYLSYRIRSITE